MTIRTQLKAGSRYTGNHNESLRVRSTVKAGGVSVNHNETLAVRSSLKAGKPRRKTATPTNDRLNLMFVRAGLRAGRRR